MRFPPAALDWLLRPDRPRRHPVLDVGGGLADQITAGSPGDRVVATLHGPQAEPVPATVPCVRAKPALLPFVPQCCDLVTVTEPDLLVSPVLAEIGRVLTPGGEVAVIEYSRDDSVGWVRRFARRLQLDDPDAMRATGSRIGEVLADSPHFVDLAEKRFRRWVPVSRDRLLGMVITRPRVAGLDPAAHDALVADLLAVYDGAARPGEKLQLPFEVVCVRARVDHSTLEPPPRRPEGLPVRLRF